MFELTVTPKKLAVPNMEGSHMGLNLKIMPILLDKHKNLNYRKEESSSLSGFCLPRWCEEIAPLPPKNYSLPTFPYPSRRHTQSRREIKIGSR